MMEVGHRQGTSGQSYSPLSPLSKVDDILSPLSPPEYKRSRHEIKKKSSDTMKLQKKARKGRLLLFSLSPTDS